MKHSSSYILFFAFIFLVKPSFAQKEDYQWIYNFSNFHDNDLSPFGGASVIDFNELPPTVYRNGDIDLDFKETNAILCNNNGQILYYSNGQEVHGPDHIALINGDTINYGPRWETFRIGDGIGGLVTTGLRGVQEIAFIPQPLTDTTIILYQNDNDYYINGDDFNLHLMLAKAVGNDLISKDQIINDEIGIVGTVVACRHANGRDWWLLQFNSSQVFSYLIDPDGISLKGSSLLSIDLPFYSIGQFKFSPDGTQLAFHGVFELNSNEGKLLLISHFDRCTGEIIEPSIEIQPSHDNFLDNGLEFSPNGNLLYITSCLALKQYDLTSENIFDSGLVIGNHNGINNCSSGNSQNPKCFGQMQLAPDNQIYVSLSSQCNDVHIIRQPDVRGENCSFEQNAIILPTYVSGTIPNTNTYRLGPLDGSSCDTLGINNDPISRFWYEQDSMDYLSVPFWDVSYFRPEEWAWTFGDGSSSSERHPLHTYTEKGVYEVCLTVSNENSNHTSCQTLYLGVSDTDDLEDSISLSVFPNPTEGLTRFLLQDYLPESGVLSLYDIEGRLFLTKPMRTGATVVDLSGLESGTYVYELRDGNRRIGGGKLVKI